MNRIMYYAVFLFQQAGIGATQGSLLANGIQGVVLNVFTWPNMFYMDTWGRRTPMVIGGVGMGISMMLIGTIMKTKGNSPTVKFLWADVNGRIRESSIQSCYAKDEFPLQQSNRVECYDCVCICLCHDLRTDMGLRCMGLPS